ncbi:hypothetical protein A5773_21300 [Mycobacterium sp. 852014-52450_SCH5900713]|nr:hypothetical protein A5773_21300 [Mycobacterium sp. 852014-52450_SCH5900713]
MVESGLRFACHRAARGNVGVVVGRRLGIAPFLGATWPVTAQRAIQFVLEFVVLAGTVFSASASIDGPFRLVGFLPL